MGEDKKNVQDDGVWKGSHRLFVIASPETLARESFSE